MDGYYHRLYIHLSVCMIYDITRLGHHCYTNTLNIHGKDIKVGSIIISRPSVECCVLFVNSCDQIVTEIISFHFSTSTYQWLPP